MRDRQPVLITGSHRSGSTFVGKMLALSPSLGYIREPFSVLHRPGVLDVKFPDWFPYICGDNEQPYARPVRDMLAFRYKLGAAARGIRSPRDLAFIGHDLREFAQYRGRGARPLLKDPIAVFSAEWLSDTFDMQTIVLIRHPAAFASSLMKYGWRHPFGDFLHQPLLMRDLLAPFQSQIASYADSEHEIIDQAILLWNLIHHVIAGYRDSRPTWCFLRHEDIARNPLAHFEEMYAYMGVEFGAPERAGVMEATSSSNPSDPARPGVVKRDSRSAAQTWKTRLTPEEVAHIREGTQAVAEKFYPDADW